MKTKIGRVIAAVLVVMALVASLMGTAVVASAAPPAFLCSDVIALVPGPASTHGGVLPTSGFPATTPSGAAFSPTFTNLDPANIQNDATDPIVAGGYDTVVLVNLAPSYLGNATFMGRIHSFIQNGGKFIIYTSEDPNRPEYQNFIRPFVVSSPGAMGATGTSGISENNTLSHTDSANDYYINTGMMDTQTDAVGDANVFTTFDPNWCEDMFAINYLNVKGPVHCYSHYGYGLIIYNGLDIDYMNNPYGGGSPATGRDYLEKIWGLELMQPWNPSGLLCGQQIAGKLKLEPVQASNPINTQHCVTANLTNGAGAPVQGTTVTFTVTGVNPTSGQDVTDVNGLAVFCYTGTNTGLDTIVATCADPDNTQLTLTSNDAFKDWTPGGTGPQVPSMTEWGIMATVIALAVLIPLALRRRALVH